MRHVNFIDDFLRDLAYTGRNLRRSPGFAALAILIMAIGIGANTAVFSIVDAVVLQPLTYRESERLFVIHEIAPKFRTLAPLFPVNALHFRVWQKRVPAFEKMALLAGTDTHVTGSGEPERITAAAVSPALFPILGIHAQMGRTFTEEDGRPGWSRVAVLSDQYWRSRFAADPNIIGRKILLSGNPNEVTRHALILNPAVSVRGERYQVVEGKTPEMTVEGARKLLASIGIGTVVELRDRRRSFDKSR